MRRVLIVSAVLGALLTSESASAQSCAAAASMLATTGYMGCAGSFLGNLIGTPAELTQLNTLFAPNGPFAYQGKSDDASNGPFTGNPAASSGTLTLDTKQFGFFVIGIKAAANYSFYEFNGGTTGIQSLAFSTIGTATNATEVPQGLSHAALYTSATGTTTTTAVVPEPSTYALMTVGLLAVAVAAGQRRKA